MFNNDSPVVPVTPAAPVPLEVFAPDAVYPPEEVARKLGISTDTLDRGRKPIKANSGGFDVAYFKIGVNIRYIGRDLNAWINAKRIIPDQKALGDPLPPAEPRHPYSRYQKSAVADLGARRKGRPTNKEVKDQKTAKLDTFK